MKQDIPNWFDYAGLYTTIAEQIPNGSTFVEIGAWVGHSISFFAQEIARLNKQNIRIVTIDTFQGSWSEEVQRNCALEHGGNFRSAFNATLEQAGVSDMVEVIQMDSAEAAKMFPDKSVFCCFVDGDHTFEGVARDLRAWIPKIAEGGILAGHDADCSDVALAVRGCVGAYQVHGRCWLRL
jgi:cephalosporin hydroxylase